MGPGAQTSRAREVLLTLLVAEILEGQLVIAAPEVALLTISTTTALVLSSGSNPCVLWRVFTWRVT